MLWIIALAAQAVPVPVAVPAARLSLKQITLPLAAIADPAEQVRRVAEFQAAAKAITTCDDVEGVAKDLGAEVVVNRDLALSQVPPALKSELATIPLGTATRMFGQRDREVRVLVLCGRSEG